MTIETAKATPELPDWAQRLVDERDEVRTRFEKLTAAMTTEGYKNLPAADRSLLETQHKVMADYVAILNVRVERLTKDLK